MKNANLVIYHKVDLDGWCSGAIVKYCKEIDNNNVGDIKKYGFEPKPTEYIGYNYNDNIPNWKDYDGDIILCDVSFPPQVMLEIKKSGKNFIWCDHHISAINGVNELFNKEGVELPLGIRNVEYAACELTWKYFFPKSPTPKAVELLGLYDSFRHKKVLPENEQQKVLDFQYACRANITSLVTFKKEFLQHDSDKLIDDYMTSGKAIFDYLCMDAQEEYKKKFDLTIDGYKFCAFNKERFNPINFGLDYHADGYDGAVCFWFNDGWNFSFYNENGKVDCSIVAKNRGGGGHKGASGCIIKSNKTLQQIIQELL